ncbi:MAG: GAF domain-containing protein [Pleurocapsa minor GSE-CHR-MK-17-07R]|nr:GAF domain-containing protein [Pleurocapsa minor GSE-CHR-MK 17-07R]
MRTARTRSLRSRIMLYVVPALLITFLVLGAVISVFLVNNEQARAVESQRNALTNTRVALNALLDDVTADIRAISEGRSAREFARDTLVSVSNTAIANSQTRMMSDMSSLLGQNLGTLMAVRYVTYTGSIWSEVTNYDFSVPRADDRVQLNALRGDGLLRAVLAAPVGAVVVSDLTFTTLEDDTLVPYYRVAAAVTSQSDTSTIAGVIEIDLMASPALDVVGLAASADDTPGRQYLLLDNLDRVLYDSTRPDISPFDIPATGGIALADLNPDLYATFVTQRDTGSGLVSASVGGAVASDVRIRPPGSLQDVFHLIVVDSGDAASQIGSQVLAVMLGAVLIAMVLSFIIHLALGRVLKPVAALADQVGRTGGMLGSLPQGSNDEVGQMSAAFASLAREAQMLREQLDTQDARYARTVNITTRIGRETATLSELDQLLNRAINLIAVEYGFYHAQVFLIDDIRKNAVLVYSTGDAGRELLARKHRLPVGSDSVVGRASLAGQAVVLSDTANPGDIPWKFNPLLPETRAEMALPLQFGDDVIGVLDVQSTTPNAFDMRDQQTFQLLADQIAVAVQNARLLRQSQERVEQIDSLNRQLTRSAWEESGFAAAEGEYTYDLLTLQPTSAAPLPPTPANATALEMPITIRGEVVGTIAAGGQDFSENDQLLMRAVAERVAIAIESARLFEETQSTLAETSTLYQLSRYLNEANDLEGIIEAIVLSVMPDATGGQIMVFDAYRGSMPESARFTADWSPSDAAPKGVSMRDIELQVSDHPLLREMNASQVSLVSDVSRDARIDEMFLAISQDARAEAMALIPFSVRGVWRGVIMIEFPRPRVFTEREGRVYSALIDQAGVAIDNRMLLAENEVALAQVERLYSASRNINMAQSVRDLVQSALSAREDISYEMGLAVFEGDIDETGWGTLVRMAAVSANGVVVDSADVYEARIPKDSPLRQREPHVLVERPETQSSSLMGIARAHGHRFVAAFPLFSANQPIALFLLMSPEPRDLSEEDYEVFRALTGQMSTVLQNRRLLDQTATALDETRRLYAASRAIATASDANAMFQAAASNLVTSSAPANRISLLMAGPLPTDQPYYYEYRYLWTRNDEADVRQGRRVLDEVIPFARILRDHDNRLLILDPRRDLHDEPSLRALLERSHSLSTVILTVRTRARWLGVLIIESDASNAFDDAYVRFATAVADQIALSIESTQLFEEARDQAQRAIALAEAAQFANRISGEAIESALEEVFERVGAAASYTSWSLSMLNGNDLVTLIRRGGVDMLSPIDLSTDDPVALSFNMKQSIMVNDPRAWPSFEGRSESFFEAHGHQLYLPVQVAGTTVGVLSVGRALNAPQMDMSDVQLTNTLAAQIAVAVENRRLFTEAQSERQTLSSILATLPAGVLVLDPVTLMPVQSNAQAEQLLGQPVLYDQPFTPELYNLQRAGSQGLYPVDELPVFAAARSGQPEMGDDIVVLYPNGDSIALLMNAAPLKDGAGHITSIIAAFEDISALRSLENTLQENLQETITLYETTRAFTEAEEVSDVLDQVVAQMGVLEPDDVLVVLLDEEYAGAQVARSLSGTGGDYALADELLNAQQAVFFDDVQSAGELSQASRVMLIEGGFRAAASMPLTARSRPDVPLGWVVVLFSRPYEFETRQDFMLTVADTAAVALENRNLFRSTETALNETASLYGATNAISRALDLNTLGEALQQALGTMQADVYAAFVARGSEIVELFNVDLDGSPADFSSMIRRHRLLEGPATQFIDDLRAVAEPNAFEQELSDAGNIRAVALVRLREAGVLILGYHDAHRFTSSDARFLSALADSTAVVLANILLLTQTERRARQLATNAQVSQFASSILEIDVLLPRVVDVVKEAFGYDHVQVFLMDENNDFAELRASTGEPGRQLLANKHRLQRGSQSVIGQVTATGVPVIASDTEDARVVHRPNPLLPNTRGEMAVPLVLKGNIVGALDVQSNKPNAFDDDDVSVLTALAAQISVALDNAQLFEQSRQRANEMSFLFTVTTAAAAAENLNEALDNVSNELRTSLEALSVRIYLPERFTDTDESIITMLRPVSLSGANRPVSDLSEFNLDLDTSLIAQAARAGRPIRVPFIEQEPAYTSADARARSAAIVPLTSGNQIVGVVVVESDQPNAFDSSTLTLLLTLSGSLSAIVQNQQLLEQVQRTNDQLRELDRLKSDFLANMSHELRTPLNSIIGFSKVILKGIDGPLTEMQEQDLGTIYSSGQHLLNLINDILDQAKISAGKMDMQADYFDMRQVVDAVRSIGIGLVKDKQINIVVDTQAGLPKAYGDELRTRQVLINLVSNAAKFTRDGSITVRSYAFKEPVSGRTMVRTDVIDTGIGIAEQDLPLLFEAFRQVDSSLTRTVGGTGLGLPIAKSLMEMMGGQILVSSTVNVGSTFSIVMPTTPPEVTEEAPDEDGTSEPRMDVYDPKDETLKLKRRTSTQEARAAGGTPEKLSTTVMQPIQLPPPPVMMIKRQILLVEDNPDMVDTFRRALQREGFEVFAASIPMEAEAMASGLHPTLIVMSATFGGGSGGWDLLRNLKQRDDTVDIPVILVSLADDEARAREAGAFAFVRRPFSPDVLVKAALEAEKDSRTARILIIDDQDDSLRLLQNILGEEAKFRIFTARSGMEGIQLVARRRPDLILLDLRMPDMDGFAVVRELKGNPETVNIPIVVVTSEALTPDEQASLNNLHVMYKTDLADGGQALLLDEVRTTLER